MHAIQASLMKGLSISILAAVLIIPGSILGQEVTIYDKEGIRDGTIYDKDWRVKGHIEDGRVYDRDWKLKERIEGDKIYDRNWNLKGRFNNDRIYDKNWNTKGYIRKGK